MDEGGAEEGAALEGAGVLEAPPGALRDRGTPASAQVPSTAVMTSVDGLVDELGRVGRW